MTERREMTELKPCPFCGGEAMVIGGADSGYAAYCPECNCDGHCEVGWFFTAGDAAEAWNTRAERTCKLEPLEAFYVTANMLDQTEWGVCSNCGTASPIDATYCCECGRKVER